MYDQADCGQREYERVSLMKFAVIAAFQNHWKRYSEYEEHKRQITATSKRFGDNIYGHDSGDRNEDEAVKNLTRNRIITGL
jgi:hypothetical protein